MPHRWEQRALPTMSISSESSDNLAELELVTLKILSSAVGYKYTEKG